MPLFNSPEYYASVPPVLSLSPNSAALRTTSVGDAIMDTGLISPRRETANVSSTSRETARGIKHTVERSSNSSATTTRGQCDTTLGFKSVDENAQISWIEGVIRQHGGRIIGANLGILYTAV
jgi:hypothetical protein